MLVTWSRSTTEHIVSHRVHRTMESAVHAEMMAKSTTEEVIIIVHESGKWVSTSKEILENVISVCKREGRVTSSKPSKATEVTEAKVTAASASATPESFLAIGVIGLPLFLITEAFIRFSNTFEVLLCDFFIRRILVLKVISLTGCHLMASLR